MIKNKVSNGRIISVILAIFAFIIIYGVYILDITYVDWIRYEGGDLAQSYYGWRFFCNGKWHWPIGLMDGVTSELTSIIYIDSIPIFNVIFKIFKNILPIECQFFGLWGIFCFILSSLIGYELIYECTRKRNYSLCASCFFLFNNIMLERLFTHTSLAANWIIILGILIVVKSKTMSIQKRIGSWIGIFFLCVSINIYYIPIIGIIMSMYCIFYLGFEKKWKEIIATILLSLFSVILTFYLYGGFYHMNINNASPSGLGYYSSNLNSLFNPMETKKYLSGFSNIFKTYPLATDGQYEAYAYLGAGLFLLGIFVFSGLLFQDKKQVKYYVKQNKSLLIGSITCFILLYILSVGTIVSFNDKILLEIPYPEFILKILAIFRSTGRFLWGNWNIYAVIMIILLFKEYKEKKGILIICLCFLLQLYDLYGLYQDRHTRFTRKYDNYSSMLFSQDWDNLVDGKEEIFLFNHQLLKLNIFYDMAQLALENNMVMNDFYFSRRDSDRIEKRKMEELNNIKENRADNKKVYIFDFIEDIQNLFGKLHFYEIDGFLIGTAETIYGLEEVQKIENILIERNDIDQNFIKITGIEKSGVYLVEIQGNEIYNISLNIGDEEKTLISKYDNNRYYSTIIDIKEINSEISINYKGSIDTIKIYFIDKE